MVLPQDDLLYDYKMEIQQKNLVQNVYGYNDQLDIPAKPSVNEHIFLLEIRQYKKLIADINKRIIGVVGKANVKQVMYKQKQERELHDLRVLRDGGVCQLFIYPNKHNYGVDCRVHYVEGI